MAPGRGGRRLLLAGRLPTRRLLTTSCCHLGCCCGCQGHHGCWASCHAAAKANAPKATTEATAKNFRKAVAKAAAAKVLLPRLLLSKRPVLLPRRLPRRLRRVLLPTPPGPRLARLLPGLLRSTTASSTRQHLAPCTPCTGWMVEYLTERGRAGASQDKAAGRASPRSHHLARWASPTPARVRRPQRAPGHPSSRASRPHHLIRRSSIDA